jgi:DNA-binding NtrC family response regulator
VTPVSERSILIVDDHDGQRALLESFLGQQGGRCTSASGGEQALAYLASDRFDLVLLDLRMDDLDGMQVLQQARNRGLDTTFLMMSAEGTIAHAVEAIRLGAADFLVKPFELSTLSAAIARVLETPPTDHDDPRLAWRDSFAPDLRGAHARLRDILLVCERIAPTDCTVLITGESGSGKELVAQAIHRGSRRRDAPFVPVNCGAIPETLIESELFGHAKGAFSGATQSREGRFAAADGGTMFLDEIAEMSMAVQVKFLRVLQEHEYVPVGETRPRPCDVRILAATNRDLGQMTRRGQFREDLYYRLNAIPIAMPPLRDRRSDIAGLATYFLEQVGRRAGGSVRTFSPEVLETLSAYAWPGNVRELQHVVERMALLHDGSGVLRAIDVPEEVSGGASSGSPEVGGPVEPQPPTVAVPRHPTPAPRVSDPPANPTAGAWSAKDVVLPDEGIDMRATVAELEWALIDQALERTDGNKQRAANLLGLGRTTLVEKLKKRRDESS